MNLYIGMTLDTGRSDVVQAVADALVEVASTAEPDTELTKRYEARYQQFR